MRHYPQSDIRAVQQLLGRADASTTMIYTHLLNGVAHMRSLTTFYKEGAYAHGESKAAIAPNRRIAGTREVYPGAG